MKYRLVFFACVGIFLALVLPACVVHVDLSSTTDQGAPPNIAKVIPPSASSETGPCTPSAAVGRNVASGKRIVDRVGGVNYGNHNDAEEFNWVWLNSVDRQCKGRALRLSQCGRPRGSPLRLNQI